MARRRTMNRKEQRAPAEEEDRQTEEEVEDEDEEEDDEEDADEEAETAGEDEAGDDEGPSDDEDEPRPKKKPKKVIKVKPVKVAKPRKSRSAKVKRMKVIWGVFNNSNTRVAAYDYPRKADADAHAAKLMADKKMTHYVQPVKEEMEEPVDAAAPEKPAKTKASK